MATTSTAVNASAVDPNMNGTENAAARENAAKLQNATRDAALNNLNNKIAGEPAFEFSNDNMQMKASRQNPSDLASACGADPYHSIGIKLHLNAFFRCVMKCALQA